MKNCISTIEIQAFYEAKRCVDAIEINKNHVVSEPFDHQLECVL